MGRELLDRGPAGCYRDNPRTTGSRGLDIAWGIPDQHGSFERKGHGVVPLGVAQRYLDEVRAFLRGVPIGADRKQGINPSRRQLGSRYRPDVAGEHA